MCHLPYTISTIFTFNNNYETIARTHILKAFYIYSNRYTSELLVCEWVTQPITNLGQADMLRYKPSPNEPKLYHLTYREKAWLATGKSKNASKLAEE